MKTQEEGANAILAEVLRPLVQEAITDALAELKEQVKPRSPKPFNVDEASRYLDIPVSSLYQLTSKKQIPFHKRGRKLYFFQDELDSWIKSKDGKR